MALLNVCSQFLIINDTILNNKIDCILLTETWLSADAPVVLIQDSPPYFNFLFSIRGSGNGGGTASIMDNTIKTMETKLYNYSTFEYHSYVFSNPNILCVTIYRPSKYPSSFIHELSEYLSNIHSQYNSRFWTE